MKNSINFQKKPFYGVLKEAAGLLGITGKHATQLVHNSYRSGNLRTTRVVNSLVKKRLAEVNESAELTQKVVALQNQSAGVQS